MSELVTNLHECSAYMSSKKAEALMVEAANEIEALRVDKQQLQRLVYLINSAEPSYQTAFGGEADHAEAALKRIISKAQQ